MMKVTFAYDHGEALSYNQFGNPRGFPVLIQHGLIASIDDSHLFDRLAENGLRLLSMARPGYGDSSPYLMKNIGEWARIVTLLVDALGITQFDVLGISSGAPYSYALGWGLASRVRRIFILSGIPALYDETIRALWPYPDNRDVSMADLQVLARRLFFADLSPEGLQENDVKDSLRNSCFGIAQDLKLRCNDWGFRLQQVSAPVIMRHSSADWVTLAEMTARLLPDCRLDVRENAPHFSPQVLDDFIREALLA